MQRSFTISDIRTAVSTCIERNLPPDHRRLVARLMCHTIDTADRFYVADPDIQDVHRSRNFVEQALGMGKHPQAKTGQPCLEDEHEITRPARRSRLIFESSEEEDVPPGPLPLSAMEIEAQQAPAPTVPPQEEHTEEETGELFSDLGLNLETPEKAICQFDLDEEEEEEWESEEEDTDSEINSPLPKVVKKDIKSGVCRRRLSYPESLKNEVVSCFAAYWHEPITTSTVSMCKQTLMSIVAEYYKQNSRRMLSFQINTVLNNNKGLLERCKDMGLTIDNFRGLIKTLQKDTKGDGEIADNEEPNV
ncbi:uncharacterized protein LOC125704485 [Brienomyrus brachyistius]|uniref:uncharacterized protein LOC125704485 n=1 Tax=Brienomyrus brachyistius TaxID=42636 RepID=UPI0020B33650|nr:uncharacterized protein LOC125704485 [Brienomyrus brachyistius]